MKKHKTQCGVAPVSMQLNAPQPKEATVPKKKDDGKNKHTKQNIKKKQTAVDVARPGHHSSKGTLSKNCNNSSSMRL